MRKILTPLIATAVLVGSACGSGSDSAGDDGDLPTLVVTTSIVGDMVTTALGDLVGSELDVEIIVPVGADAHVFAPSAKQAETMENADLLVVNGLGYEESMGDLIVNAMDSGAVVFVLAGQLESEEGADPHVWLDPVLMAETFADLPQIVAETTGVPIGDVRSSVAEYIAELTALDATISAQLDPSATTQRTIVTNHDALSRFAARYDLVVVDTIIPSVSTSAEASAADLDDVLDAIHDNGVRAIFSESTASDDLAQALAAEIGEDIAVVEIFTESLGEPGSDADTYIGMMTVNAERIAAALR
jgi:zinc/manganese transport system substrate-binding protein